MDRKTALTQFLEEDPADPFLHYAMALELQKELNYQEALRYFLSTIRLDPSYTAAYYQLGMIYRELDIVDVARSFLEKGLQAAEEKKDRKTMAEFSEALESL